MKQLSATKSRPKYRLSPNEVEQLKKEETERRRKLRIVQVREQAKNAAAKIRNDVRQERKRQLIKLAHEIEGQLEEEKQEEVKRLEQRYDNTLHSIGQGHTQALITDKKTSHAEQQCIVVENRQRAEDRHREALRHLAMDKAYKEYEETRWVRDRQAALVEERKRAAEVASRPPPPPDPINDAFLEKYKYKKPIPVTDLNAFSSTHYNIPDFAVEKAPPEQQHDAKSAGEEEDIRTKEEIAERQKKRHDQLVQARIRGSEALKKEILKHDYEGLMADLSLQQRADRRRRQQVVAKLPKQVFLPPDRRLEELEEKQMEMERVFEDMYTQQINISGDLSLTLDPNPFPQTPVDDEEDSLAQAEESPVVISTMPAINPALKEVTNVSRSQKPDTQQEKPQTILKKLLNRIKEQRSEVEAQTVPQRKTRQENLGPEKKDMPDKGSRMRATRRPVAKPTADPQLDLSPHRAEPGNQRPQKSPVMQSTTEADLETEDSTDSETGFLDKLKVRIQAIEAQKELLDQKMKERLEQQEQTQLLPHQMRQPQSLSSFPTASGSQSSVHTTYFHGTVSAPLPQPAAVQETPAGSRAPISAVSSFPQAAAVHTGPAGVFPSTSGDVWKRTEYGQNLQQEASRESTLGTGSSVQRLAHQSSNERFLLPGQPNLAYTTSYIQPQSTSQAPPSAAQLFLSSQARMVTASVPGSTLGFSTISWPVNSVGLRLAGGDLLSAPQRGESGGSVDAGAGVGAFLRNLGQSSIHPYPPSSTPSQHPPSSAFVSSVAATSFPTRSYLSSVLGSLQPHPIPSFQPQLSFFGKTPTVAATGQSGAQTFPTRTSLADTGDRLSAFSEQTDRPTVDYGMLAVRLAAGLPEQERLQHVREYQQHLVQKHQERMKALQEVRSRIESRQSNSVAQATSIGGSLSTSQRLADPAVMVPYTLKTYAGDPSISSIDTSSSFLPSWSAAPVSTSLGFTSHFMSESKPSGGGLASAGLLSSVGFRGTTNTLEASRGFSLAAEPILAGSAGIAVPRATNLMASVGQPLSDGEKKPDTGFQRKASSNFPEHVGSRRSSGGSSNKLDDVRKSLPFDNPDDTLHQEGDHDIGGTSLNEDSLISSSTDRGSPALGSRSNKSSMSGKSASVKSEGSARLIGGSSLVARAEGKSLDFEQSQKELQGQLAEIQQQKDTLLQRYQGTQQRILTQEEDLRCKLKSAQALSASSSAAGQTLALRTPATALSLGVRQSSSPSMELEEGSLTSEHLDRASLSSERLGGSTSRNWAMELEEYSIERSRAEKGAATYKSPSSVTLEEYSINSDHSTGNEGMDRESGGTVTKANDQSVKDSRTFSSLSSLEEYPNHWSHGPEVRGSTENLPGKVHSAECLDPDSVMGTNNLRTLMVDLLAGGDYFSSQKQDGLPESSSHLPPPPTRQPAPIVEYQPHELSTILEVDTPQTGAKSTAAAFSQAAATRGVVEKPSAKRHIDFVPHSVGLPEDSKLPSDRPSAMCDIASAIEGRAGVLRTGVDLPGNLGEMRFADSSVSAFSHRAALTDTGDHRWSPRGANTSSSSSTREYQPLELTLDSLTSQSISMEDALTTPRESLVVNRWRGDGQLTSQVLRDEDYARNASTGRVTSVKVDEVLKQARQFNQDMMENIQRRTADAFDQSSLSYVSAITPGDATLGSLL